MTIFASDLDNTLIYSYKHDIGIQKRNVEKYQAREVSFITDKTYHLLKEVNQKTLFLPVTTRSIEQYKRIEFGIGKIKYALACNGGVLLVNGEKDLAWYNKSLEIVKPCLNELKKGISLLEDEPSRKFEIRFIENLFVFTKCENPEKTLEMLRKALDTNLVDTFNNGEKIYIIPKELNKGNALRRFKDLIKADFVIACGDSEFDISMLEKSDLALIPQAFRWQLKTGGKILINDEKTIFSDFILENVLGILSDNFKESDGQ